MAIWCAWWVACVGGSSPVAGGDGDPSNDPPDPRAPPRTAPTGELPLRDAHVGIVAEAKRDDAGRSLAAAGDLDSDGYGDLILGAPGANVVAEDAGAAYVVTNLQEEEVALAKATARILGEDRGDEAGWSVAGRGDANGDGIPDLLIGAPGEDEGGSGAGAVYLLYGPVAGDIDLANADAKIIGDHSGDRAGSALAFEDFDGDGLADLLIGAPNADLSGGDEAGRAYVLYAPIPEHLDLRDADLEIDGDNEGDHAGQQVAAAGDVNGDGEIDLLVGVPSHDGTTLNSGEACLFLSPYPRINEVEDADLRFHSSASNAETGRGVSGAGDVNGDGYADVLIGAPRAADEDGIPRGIAALQLGAADPIGSTGGGSPAFAMLVSAADAVLWGEVGGDNAGDAVAGAGDVDGDGFDDVLVSAPYYDVNANQDGAVYLVYGPILGEASLAEADLRVVAAGLPGATVRAVASAGDLDADGADDVLIGTNVWSDWTYVIYGGF